MATRSTQRNLGRLSEIAQVAVRHGFGYFFEKHKLTDLLPWGHRAQAEAIAPNQRGVHLREMLDELGPTFVKFGQLLSTRPDIVPPDIIVELRSLQDDVRPFPFEQVEQVVESELGLSLERAFLEFDPVPIAAASIGQVHRATLPNGKSVAVKVQRPGHRGRSIPTSRCSTRRRASRRNEFARSTSSTLASSSTNSDARSAPSSTTAPRGATPSASAAIGPATDTSRSRGSTGATHGNAS